METRLSIPRMHCNGCLKKVTGTLQNLPSVAIIATDLPAKTLQLHFDPEQIAMEQIKTALEKADYPIEEAHCLVEAEKMPGAVESPR
jgi:copper chaperone CopZ